MVTGGPMLAGCWAAVVDLVWTVSPAMMMLLGCYLGLLFGLESAVRPNWAIRVKWAKV